MITTAQLQVLRELLTAADELAGAVETSTDELQPEVAALVAAASAVEKLLQEVTA